MADDLNPGPKPPLPFEPPSLPAQSSSKACGCWAIGCLGSAFAGLLLIVALGFGGYWFITQQVEKYTDAEPEPLPAIEMQDEEVAALKEEVDSFLKQVSPIGDNRDSRDSRSIATPPEKEADGQTELVLTARQINALLQMDETLRGRALVEIEDGLIRAKVSIPTDQIPGGAGRYFNADAQVDVRLDDGVLVVQLVNAQVKGEPLPERFIQELAKENLAKDLSNDARTVKVLRRFDSIEVEGSTIRLRLKRPESTLSEPPSTNATTAEAPIPAE